MLQRLITQNVPFAVKREGIPIREYQLKDAINSGITYSNSFLELEAVAEAGLDFYKWTNDEYSVRFKARVIAWYNMHNLIKVHSQDAEAKEMEKERRKHKNR